MSNVVSSSFQFNESDYDAVPEYARDETISTSKYDPNWFEMDQSGFMDLFSSLFGQDNISPMIGNGQETISNHQTQHGFCNRIASIEPVRPPESEFDKSTANGKQSSYSIASWDLLKNYSKGLSMPRDEISNYARKEEQQRLSVEEILMIAGERFIQFSTNRIDGISMFILPYSSSLSHLSANDSRDVELLHFLLSAADFVGLQQLDHASKLVSRCLWVASDCGSPAQRLSSYFAQALQEKINKESGILISNENRKNPEKEEEKGIALSTNNIYLAIHQELPFVQVVQFAGIQAIIENVKKARKIHLIDLQIRSGIIWTALMQGLAECSIKRLKITAVGTADQRCIEETGRRLESFAKSLNLPFLFKVVYLTDMKEFREDLLDIEADETVAVYSFMMLRSMISKPDSLENLMRAITRLKPAIMVVVEVEANHNSPSFIDRFAESLLFYSAYFDCLEECMDRNSQCRKILEGSYFRRGITNIVAADDQERITRSVKLDIWRAFFARFRMIEVELSGSSKYQASLVLDRFTKGSLCNLEWDGKGLIVGWKGTPLQSLTAWKFS